MNEHYAHGGIKSKERAQKFAEVFTPERIVKQMCDMLEQENEDAFTVLTKTFLDPAVGTGNFPAEILRRKFAICETALDGIVALGSIYAVDIQEDNVQETRQRLREMYIDRFGTEGIEHVDRILCKNIVCGDFLTTRTPEGKPIWFLAEYIDGSQMDLFDSEKEQRGGKHELR